MSQPAATPSLQVNISSKQILTISIPIALAILVPQFNFIINNIFLGALSKQALAIGGITGVYYLIFGVMGQGLNNGLQALISRRAGENRVDEIGVLFNQGVIISIFLSIVGIGFTYFIAPTIFHALLIDSERANTVIEFLKIRIWGIPFLFIYQMRNALLVGTNQSKFLIIGTATEALFNIFFDYSLIFGHFGFTAMGLNGAAYASIIAEIMGLLVIYLVIHYQKIGARFDLFKKFELKMDYIKLILVQSSPLMMQYMISIISWEFFYILIEHTIMINVFAAQFLSIYGQGEGFLTEGIPVLRIVSVALLLMSASTIWLSAVTGTGQSKVTLLIEFAAIIIYIIYNYLVLEYYKMPITYGWFSEIIYWLSLLIPSFFYIRTMRWKNKKI